MDKKIFWKALLLALGIFFLLHAIGVLRIIKMEIISALFGIRAITSLGFIDYTLTPIVFLILVFLISAVIIKFVSPKKLNSINPVLNDSNKMISWFGGVRYLVYCFIVIFIIKFAELIANFSINALFLFLAVLCFDKATNLIEKIVKRKHEENQAY